MFVCSFTFLAVMAHTASGMFEGEMSYSGKGRGSNGFVFFGLILLMGSGISKKDLREAEALRRTG